MVWSQEKILLKKQVTRRTSSALRPGQKALGFGPGDLGCFLFLPPCAWSTSSNDLSPPPVAVTSQVAVPSQQGALPQTTLCGPQAPSLLFGVLSNTHLPAPKCGVSQMLWGTAGLMLVKLVLGPWGWLPIPGGQPREQIVLAESSVFLSKECMGYQNDAARLILDNSSCLYRQLLFENIFASPHPKVGMALW